MSDAALVDAAIRVVELAAITTDSSSVSAKLLNHAEQYLLRAWDGCNASDDSKYLTRSFRPDCSPELPQARVVAPGFADGID